MNTGTAYPFLPVHNAALPVAPWCAQERAGTTRSALERPGTPRNVLERPGTTWNAQEYPGTPWNALERFGTLRNVLERLERLGAPWNVLERLRTPWSALERPGTFWNALERLRTPWNTLVWNHKAQKLNPPSSGNRFSRTLEYATSTFPFMAARKFEPSTRNCQKARGGFEKNQTFFPKCSMI